MQSNIYMIFFQDKEIEADIIIDVFGGSGILSNLFKQMYPEKRIIYNDYDNYSKRIKYVEETNGHLDEIRQIVNSYFIKEGQCIGEKCKEEIAAYIEKIKELEYVDWLTLESNLAFRGSVSTHNIKEMKGSFYNKIRKGKISVMANYLQGVEIINEDYRGLIDRTIDGKVLYILDPPYIQTYMKKYKKGFDLKECLELLKRMREMHSFIYFSQDDAGIQELLNYIDKNYFCEKKDEIIFHSSISKTEKALIKGI